MAGAAAAAPILRAWTIVIAEGFEKSDGGKLEMSIMPSDGADGLEVEERMGQK